MRPVFSSVVVLFALSLLVVSVSCGGGNSPAATGAGASGLAHRVFVTNTFSSAVQIVNGDNDQLVSASIIAGTNPTIMVVDPNKTRTLVFSTALKVITVINNSSETVSGSIALPIASSSTILPNSIAISPDGNTGYVAGLDIAVSGQPFTGAVLVLDLVNNNIKATVPVALARTLALSPDGAKLLAFSETLDSAAIIANPSAATATTTATVMVTANMDHPVAGVFSSDSARAYVLNCGAECGGTQARVTAVDITQLGLTPPAAPVAGTLNVNAATVGLLNASTLYVAGTPAGSGSGVVTPIALVGNALPGAAGTPVAIGTGFHNQMALGANNKLFIGAINCNGGNGCLSVFDTGALTGVIDNAADPNSGAPRGSVTGITALPNRSFVYVVSGGRLRVYDATSANEVAGKINIVGQAYDVKAIY